MGIKKKFFWWKEQAYNEKKNFEYGHRKSVDDICVCFLGQGEQGKPFPLIESDRVDQAYRENGFNIYVSNRISLNRSLPDIRHEK